MLRGFLLALVVLATGDFVTEWALGLAPGEWRYYAVKFVVMMAIWIPGWYWIMRGWRREAAEKSGR